MIRFIFYSNFLNPHQYPIGEELFRLTGGRYRFIETEKMPDAFHRGVTRIIPARHGSYAHGNHRRSPIWPSTWPLMPT